MGRILSLTGPSLTGKTSVAGEIIRTSPKARMVKSFTTREPRPSDLPGEYVHVDIESFNKLKEEGKFLWTKEHGGNWYGTNSDEISAILNDKDALGIMILVPEVLNILHEFLKQKDKESFWIPVFFTTPSRETVAKRLVIRGDSKSELDKRVAREGRWEEIARASPVPFHFVDSEGTVKKMSDDVMAILDGVSK